MRGTRERILLALLMNGPQASIQLTNDLSGSDRIHGPVTQCLCGLYRRALVDCRWGRWALTEKGTRAAETLKEITAELLKR